MNRITAAAVSLAVVGSLGLGSTARADVRTFETGSLVIPMDLSYQDESLFQAYGLVFQLLRQDVTVYWVIDPAKTWHDAPCDTVGDECTWDCDEEGSGVRCPYPTASPDFFVGAHVLWSDGSGPAVGATITRHGYRGGPFVIAAADAARARPIIDAWNDMTQWTANPWARRTVFSVVTVHETTAPFMGNVRKEMIAAPTIAVFSDGNEDIATGYLRAAGIPQSNGTEFPTTRCGAAGTCGPGTANPDMLTVESIMGEMGTCDAPNLDHHNGSLFTADGVPAYCQIMSMHWAVASRETVECDGGACPATQAACSGQTFTYHGHEVVAEVRQFLNFPTHFFAECQAVNAYENTVPNPAWPYLDDPDRNGHFLTTTGTPPSCPCTDAAFQCVTGGCDGGTRDCCQPRGATSIGAGFLVAAQPTSSTLQILSPEVPYNQLDGAFQTVGGSEPAYNLSTYLGTTYSAGADVTFITGPMGPGDQDVWMTGYLDGTCDIAGVEFPTPGMCNQGKVSYLGGHRYSTAAPLSANEDAQGTRLFLNALFEADCVTTVGQPSLALTWTGRTSVGLGASPVEEPYSVRISNSGRAPAIDGVLTVTLPAGVEVTAMDAGASVTGSTITWDLPSIGASGAATPPSSLMRGFTLRFSTAGTYTLSAEVTHHVGVSTRRAMADHVVMVSADRDGDGVPDTVDAFPDDPMRCGDSDMDTCDDCSVAGTSMPHNDGPDADGDGICDRGEMAHSDGGTGTTPPPASGGCGCAVGTRAPSGAVLMLLVVALRVLRRRRAR